MEFYTQVPTTPEIEMAYGRRCARARELVDEQLKVYPVIDGERDAIAFELYRWYFARLEAGEIE